MHRSYSKNGDDTIDGVHDKIKLIIINCKIIMFINVILNKYLTQVKKLEYILSLRQNKYLFLKK